MNRTIITKKSLANKNPSGPGPSTSGKGGETDKVQGEGDYEAARRHRASVEKFVKSGQVDQAARNAEPETAVEEVEMLDAEREGEQHSKGEDPSPARSPKR